ncbi:MAG: hypothetical protein JW940_20765 [Polyangiaceae bacterium]|nr:hypothetical protein [Polyangiaceae bacterium]
MRLLLSLSGLLLLLPSQAARADGTEIVVIVGVRAGVQRLSPHELSSIFATQMRRWPDGRPIVALNLPPRTPLRVEFDQAVLRMDPDAVGRYWVDRRIRGGDSPPRVVPTPGLMARVVANLDGSIGYVPSSALIASVRVVARVRQGKVVRP